jgi:monoamine oxidase
LDILLMLSRRSFLASSAAVAAAPALGAVPASGEVDVAIVGAGAAGIAAARRVAAANARFALLEAGNGIGGRCVTDVKIFGMPFDLGAHWIRNPDRNPLSRLAPKAAFDIYSAPRGQTVRIGPRNARDAELENFLSLLVRSHRAIADAGRAGAEAAAAALPRELGDWRATIEFILGPYTCGKDLRAVSATDLARAAERAADAFCRQGYGALLAWLAADLPVRLATPVRRIESGRRGIDVDTRNGMLRARTVIVTVSTNVLASDKIEFRPELSKRQLDAAAKLSLGNFDHIALDMPGNPLGLQRDDVVFEQSTGARTAALLANVSGTSLHMVEVAGNFGRELAAQGRAAMIDFAAGWLAASYGSDIKRAIKRSHATRWNDEPWVLGAMSAAAPGSADARRILMEPVGGRIWFAGEAVHDTEWGTVAGAWDSGTRAAEAALRQIGLLKEPEQEERARLRKGEDRPPRRSRHNRRRRRGDE